MAFRIIDEQTQVEIPNSRFRIVEETPRKVSKAESAARGGLQGATLGFADEISGGLGALYARAMEPDLFADQPWSQTYKEGRDINRQQNKEAEAANPKTYLGSQLATGLVIPVKGLGAAPTLTTKMGVGFGYGAAAGLGGSDSETPLGVGIDTAIGGAIGAALPPVIDKAINTLTPVVTPAINAVKNVLKPKTPAIVNTNAIVSGVGADDIKNAVSQANDDVRAYFEKNIRDGLTPEQALIKAQADSFKVRLSRGDITQDVTEQGLEDAALKGVHGDKNKALAVAFREQQQADLRRMAGNVGAKIGEQKKFTPSNEADVADSIVTRVRAMEAAERKQGRSLYDQFKDLKAYAPKKEVGNLSSSMRKVLDEEQFDIEALPSVNKRLMELDKYVEKLDDGANVSIGDLEKFRKRIVNSSAGSDAERAALGIMKRTFDGYSDDLIDRGIWSGDPGALEKIKEARNFWAVYKKKYYGDDGKAIIGKIIKGDYTPERTMQYLVGTGRLGANKQASKVVGQLKDILGEKSPEFIELKQAGFLRLFGDDLQGILEGNLAKPISGEVYANRVNQFLKENKSLANTLYTPDELREIIASARVAAQATKRQPGAVNYSGTTPTMLRYFNSVMGRLGTPGRVISGATERAYKAAEDKMTEKQLQEAFAGQVKALVDKQRNNPFATRLATKLSTQGALNFVQD